MSLTCVRCGADLPPEADSTLTYCSHCGMPQVFLSESLSLKAAEANRVYTEQQADPDRQQNAPTRAADPTAIMWKAALRCIALVAGIMGVLTVMNLRFPSFMFFIALWVMASPVVAISVYNARYPLSRLSASFGARMGLLAGIASLLVLGVLKIAAMDLTRHAGRMNDFDALWPLMMQRATQQSGADPAMMAFFLKPEFRVGMMLSTLALLGCFLLVLTTMMGAFAGLMRARPRPSV
jgi:hypothetical protein